MQIDRDYDIAIAKIPRTDRSGNDITEDKLGGGGRHRPDGTISGMAYDFEITDLTRAANEMKITEEGLGYILAMINEYGATVEFGENSYRCEMINSSAE